MSDEPPPGRGEAARVALIGEELARAGIPADLTDDCAHLRGATALVSTDTLVEGVHFDRAHDTLEQIGAQAAVSNLSDLAGSGGAAGWMAWSLCLPPTWSTTDLQLLTRGCARVAAAHGARIVGGNLSRIDGPAVIAVTVGGPLAADRILTRDGARPGDTLYVTGRLGDAALGVVDGDAEARAARHAWRPHLREAAALARWPGTTAAMDISDGLLVDAGRLGAASGVALDIDSTRVPVSDLYRARRGGATTLAMTGGEDYVLLFTATPGSDPPIECWPVGRCRYGRGLFVDGAERVPAGYDHFGGSGG